MCILTKLVLWGMFEMFTLHRSLKGWSNFSSVAWKRNSLKPAVFIVSKTKELIGSLSKELTEKQGNS